MKPTAWALGLLMAVAFAALACGESQPDPAPVRLVLEGHAQVQGAPLATNTALGEMLVSRCTSEISEAVTATRSIDLGAGPVEIPVVTFEFSYQADGTASGATPGGAPLPIHLEQTGEVTIDFARLMQGKATNDVALIASAFTETSSMAITLRVPVKDGAEVRELRLVDQTPDTPDLQVLDGALVATVDTDRGTFGFEDIATDPNRQQQFCDWRIEIEATAPGWYVALLDGP